MPIVPILCTLPYSWSIMLVKHESCSISSLVLLLWEVCFTCFEVDKILRFFFSYHYHFWLYMYMSILAPWDFIFDGYRFHIQGERKFLLFAGHMIISNFIIIHAINLRIFFDSWLFQVNIYTGCPKKMELAIVNL